MVNENWEISGHGSVCDSCNSRIEPKIPLHSILLTENGQLVRRNFCANCWSRVQTVERQRAFAYWRTQRAPKDEPKRNYTKLDMDLVWRIFTSMSETEQEGNSSQVELRYVLALMLLRRRTLELVRSSGQVLEFQDKAKERYRLKEPSLSKERIEQLTSRLGELLWERQFASI